MKHRINALHELNREEICSIFDGAGLGEVLEFRPVEEGMSNTGYKVICDFGKYLLKIYSKATGKAEAGMLNYLAGKISAPKLFCYEKEKPVYTITEYIEGMPFDKYLKEGGLLTSELISQIGTMLGTIHSRRYKGDATLDFNLEPLTARPLEHEKLLYTLTRKPAKYLNPQLVQSLVEYVHIHMADFFELESASVLLHGDVSFENMLIKEGRIYFIDFEFASSGSPYCDIGHLLRSVDFDLKPQITPQLLESFKTAYNLASAVPLKENWLYLSKLADLNSLLCLLNMDNPPQEWISAIEEEIQAIIHTEK